MKKLILLIGIILPVLSSAQITTTSVAKKVEDVDNTPYDSLQNFLGKDVHKYIGQEFYLKGMAKNVAGQRSYGGFLIDYQKGDREKSNIYKRVTDIFTSSSDYHSDYDSLVGKYFTVLDVIKHPKASDDESYYSSKYFIKLKEKASGDIVYYQYNSKFDSDFSFVVVGYFIKQKELYIGNEFISRKLIKQQREFTDIETGKTIQWESNIQWKCIDVTIEEKYYTVSLILENSNNEKAARYIGTLDLYLFTLDDAAKYEKKFGKEKWLKILDGSINNGYTTEMVRLAWGEPDKINLSSTGEQWVYGTTYLYFDIKGLLIGFN